MSEKFTLEKLKQKKVIFLVERSDGILINAVDANGGIWNIAKIADNGKMLVYRSVPDRLGLDLDCASRIVIERQEA